MQGSGFFLGGMSAVIIGWPMIGMAMEAYGFILLFAGFFPTVIMFLKKVPGLSKILDSPAFKAVSAAQHSPPLKALVTPHPFPWGSTLLL